MKIEGQGNSGNESQMATALTRATAGQEQQAQTQQPQQTNDQSRSPTRFASLGSLLNMPFSRSQAGEALASLTKALKESLENQFGTDSGVLLLPLDRRNVAQLPVSVLVVALYDKTDSNPKSAVAFHTLLVDASYEGRRARNDTVGDRQIEINFTVGDANNRTLAELVKNELAVRFPGRRLINAEACTVPQVFDYKDATACHQLLINAMAAAFSTLRMSTPGWKDLNIASIADDSSLQIESRFAQPDRATVCGIPVRSDIQLAFSTVDKQRGPQAQQGIQPDDTTHISRVTGYIDLVALRDPRASMQFFQNQQQTQAPVYAARFVATGMEGESVSTPSIQLLGLVTANSLKQNNAWAQGLMPVHRPNERICAHDIGAIGLEVNLANSTNGIGERFDTTPAVFGPDTLNRMLQAYVDPRLIISLDVDEAGPDTWINGVFAAAAKGSEAAQNQILNQANELTDGAFARFFPAGARVADAEQNRIQLGYYIGENGEKVDLRHIDTLFALNYLADRDPAAYRDFKNSYNASHVDLNVRLALRKKIAELLRVEMVITGHAIRATISEQFLDALLKGLEANKFGVKAIHGGTNLTDYESASYGYFHMLNSQATSNYSVFQRASNTTSGNNFGSNFGSRF